MEDETTGRVPGETRSQPPTFMKPRDLIIIGVLLLAGLAGWWWLKARPAEVSGTVARVYVDDALYGSYPLEGSGAPDHVEVGDTGVVLALDHKGGISFESSDCRDQLCVHYGRISHVHESFACLPNRVIVVIEQVGEADPDATEPPDIIVG